MYGNKAVGRGEGAERDEIKIQSSALLRIFEGGKRREKEMREVVLPVRSGTNAPLQIIKLNQKSLATKLLLESSFRQRQPEKKKEWWRGGRKERHDVFGTTTTIKHTFFMPIMSRSRSSSSTSTASTTIAANIS